MIVIEPRAPTALARKPREKPGATALSFAILEHVANAHAPVDVLDIIGSLKLPPKSPIIGLRSRK